MPIVTIRSSTISLQFTGKRRLQEETDRQHSHRHCDVKTKKDVGYPFGTYHAVQILVIYP